MTNKDKLEAKEQMSQLAKIVEGWKDETTEDVAYQVPLTGKPIEDVGKCRVVFDFASLSDAVEMVDDYFGHQASTSLFMMDSIASEDVPVERTFIVRRNGDMPKDFRLHKITVNVAPVGG